MLEFCGIQKTTLVDYPGEVACTLFLAGCRWRCSYCHNQDLVLNRDTGVRISADEALTFLGARHGFLDGVCVTGGEPLLHYPALRDFLHDVKDVGYKVKLDTSGARPGPLEQLLCERLVDYVAMDIKAPPGKYPAITRVPVDIRALQRSIDLIRDADIHYEFRTTTFSGLTPDDFDAIGLWLKGSRAYYLQTVRTDVPLLDPEFSSHYQPLSLDTLEGIAQRLRPYFDVVHVRS